MRKTKPRIICEPEDTALFDRIVELSDDLRVPMRIIVEATLSRLTDKQLATHVRVWQANKTRLGA